MIDKSISQIRCASALGLIFPLVLLCGCGTATQQERPLPIAITPEARPPAQTDNSSLPSPAPGDAKQNEVAATDEERSIFFALGSSAILPKEKVKLRGIASLLKEDKSLFVTLAGHANENGSRSLNLAVADARVESVGSYLRKQGVSPRQITRLVIGGEKTPRTCLSTECRQRMRRVEIRISNSEKVRSNGVTR